jgi:hypothetical protein
METFSNAAGPGNPAGGRFLKSEHSLPPHRLKKPPYFNSVDLSKQNACLVIFTGSDAWLYGRLPDFYSHCKVVLPPGDDPGLYDWSVARGSDVVIFPFGDYEPLAVIARLAGLLLAVGAGLVVYCPEPGRGGITRFDARRAA